MGCLDCKQLGMHDPHCKLIMQLPTQLTFNPKTNVVSSMTMSNAKSIENKANFALCVQTNEVALLTEGRMLTRSDGKLLWLTNTTEQVKSTESSMIYTSRNQRLLREFAVNHPAPTARTSRKTINTPVPGRKGGKSTPPKEQTSRKKSTGTTPPSGKGPVTRSRSSEGPAQTRARGRVQSRSPTAPKRKAPKARGRSRKKVKTTKPAEEDQDEDSEAETLEEMMQHSTHERGEDDEYQEEHEEEYPQAGETEQEGAGAEGGNPEPYQPTDYDYYQQDYYDDFDNDQGEGNYPEEERHDENQAYHSQREYQRSQFGDHEQPGPSQYSPRHANRGPNIDPRSNLQEAIDMTRALNDSANEEIRRLKEEVRRREEAYETADRARKEAERQITVQERMNEELRAATERPEQPLDRTMNLPGQPLANSTMLNQRPLPYHGNPVSGLRDRERHGPRSNPGPEVTFAQPPSSQQPPPSFADLSNAIMQVSGTAKNIANVIKDIIPFRGTDDTKKLPGFLEQMDDVVARMGDDMEAIKSTIKSKTKENAHQIVSAEMTIHGKDFTWEKARTALYQFNPAAGESGALHQWTRLRQGTSDLVSHNAEVIRIHKAAGWDFNAEDKSRCHTYIHSLADHDTRMRLMDDKTLTTISALYKEAADFQEMKRKSRATEATGATVNTVEAVAVTTQDEPQHRLTVTRQTATISASPAAPQAVSAPAQQQLPACIPTYAPQRTDMKEMAQCLAQAIKAAIPPPAAPAPVQPPIMMLSTQLPAVATSAAPAAAFQVTTTTPSNSGSQKGGKPKYQPNNDDKTWCRYHSVATHSEEECRVLMDKICRFCEAEVPKGQMMTHTLACPEGRKICMKCHRRGHLQPDCKTTFSPNNFRGRGRGGSFRGRGGGAGRGKVPKTEPSQDITPSQKDAQDLQDNLDAARFLALSGADRAQASQSINTAHVAEPSTSTSEDPADGSHFIDPKTGKLYATIEKQEPA